MLGEGGAHPTRYILATAVALATLLGTQLFGCAEAVEFPEDNAGGSAQGGSAQGGSAQGGAAQGGDGGSMPFPCGQDCSLIEAPACFQAVCNQGMHEGPVGACVVVPAEAGGVCDDGLFCTSGDSCDGNGVCVGGPQNTCGLTPGECETVTCDEASQACSTVASSNGDPCTSADLCLVGTTCQNGLCIGTENDCFFSPVPDECHVAVCNPSTGMCEPEPGNDGEACIDQSDLCIVGHTCSGGVCSGGSPKDCSALNVGCNTGVCDQATGQCVPQPIANGDPCDDQNNCTNGETCQNGSCTGGTPITQCIAGDQCCPMGCVEATDADCSCSVNLALQATASNSGGGSNGSGYGPANWNDGISGNDYYNNNCVSPHPTNNGQGWVSNTTTPSGAWVQYTWPGPVTIGSMHIDTADCNGMSCDSGRLVDSGTVQWWDGQAWQTAQSFSGMTGDFTLSFNPALNTNMVRIFDITASSLCAQTSNSLMYEWYVWPGSGCSPPP